MNRSQRRRRRQETKGHDLLTAGRLRMDVRVPPPYKAIVDACAARDREYFEQHPASDRYIRLIVPGELWTPDGTDAGAGCDAMLVTKIAKGLRTRQPVKLKADSRAGNVVRET